MLTEKHSNRRNYYIYTNCGTRNSDRRIDQGAVLQGTRFKKK